MKDAQNILGFYALRLRPGQTLKLPAVTGDGVPCHRRRRGSSSGGPALHAEADTCCAPGYVGVTMRNRSAGQPSFLFIADESPLHRKLGVFENRG